MKCRVHTGLVRDALANILPRLFCERLPTLPPRDITLLIFPHDRDDVVASRTVQASLSGLEHAATLIAVAGCFTAEAAALLRASGALMLQLDREELLYES